MGSGCARNTVISMPNDDDKSGAAGQQQQQDGQGGDNGQNDGSASEKFYTDDQVQKIVSKRVRTLAKTNEDLLARIDALEKGTAKKSDEGDKDKDPIAKLNRKIEELEKKSADADARAAKAELDKLKLRMAKKYGLPGWLDPAMLPGNDEDEVEAAIENILEQMAEEEEAKTEGQRRETDKRMKRSFGEKVPKGKEQPLSGDAYMDRLMLRAIGRSVPR